MTAGPLRKGLGVGGDSPSLDLRNRNVKDTSEAAPRAREMSSSTAGGKKCVGRGQQGNRPERKEQEGQGKAGGGRGPTVPCRGPTCREIGRRPVVPGSTMPSNQSASAATTSSAQKAQASRPRKNESPRRRSGSERQTANRGERWPKALPLQNERRLRGAPSGKANPAVSCAFVSGQVEMGRGGGGGANRTQRGDKCRGLVANLKDDRQEARGALDSLGVPHRLEEVFAEVPGDGVE